VGIGLLLAFILVRRTWRQRYFRRRDARTFAIRNQWEAIVSQAVPPETWRNDRMDTEIIQAILLDRLEVAPPQEASQLLNLLRSTGLLDMRIAEARKLRGWRRHRVLVSLGRMRAPEAIVALAEALDDADAETRAAAVRGLGRSGLPEAARPILERLAAGSNGLGLRVPARPVQATLVNCCQGCPAMLVPYLERAEGQARELIARVLGEVATPAIQNDLLLLAGDSSPEVRASAARALGAARSGLALPVLAALATDSEWFVRLRAVAGLAALEDSRAIPSLVGALCDANRQVRLRAAASLVQVHGRPVEVLEHVVATRDPYALQTFISELERSGRLGRLVDQLSEPAQQNARGEVLLDALRAASQQLRDAAAPPPKPEQVAR